MRKWVLKLLRNSKSLASQVKWFFINLMWLTLLLLLLWQTSSKPSLGNSISWYVYDHSCRFLEKVYVSWIELLIRTRFNWRRWNMESYSKWNWRIKIANQVITSLINVIKKLIFEIIRSLRVFEEQNKFHINYQLWKILLSNLTLCLPLCFYFLESFHIWYDPFLYNLQVP